jgi:Fe-S-cluster containining protein
MQNLATVVQKPRREELPQGANLCEYCTAKCCRYFALPIDTPSERRDLEFIRWYLLHDRATIFVENQDWYLLVYTTCRHLEHDNRCGIYDTRPPICREYSTKNCEYEDDSTYDRYFERAEQVSEYIDALFPPKNAKKRRTPKPTLLPIIG